MVKHFCLFVEGDGDVVVANGVACLVGSVEELVFSCPIVSCSSLMRVLLGARAVDDKSASFLRVKRIWNVEVCSVKVVNPPSSAHDPMDKSITWGFVVCVPFLYCFTVSRVTWLPWIAVLPPDSSLYVVLHELLWP